MFMFRCSCDLTELRPSQRRWFDFLLMLLLLRPFRCTGCYRRCYRFIGMHPVDQSKPVL